MNEKHARKSLPDDAGTSRVVPKDIRLDQQITAALASPPQIPIPLGFAARVARAAGAQRAALIPRLRLRWGLSAVLVSSVFLLGAMFWLASAVHGEARLGAFAVIFQTIYLAEFALAIWGAMRFRQLLH